MRKTKSIPVLTALAALALSMAASAHVLKDISLVASGGQAHLKLAFAAGPGEGAYPLYFQKADADKGTLTLSFLDAETGFALGRHTLDTNAPEIEEFTLKKITSPSGKNFLGIEVKLRSPSLGDAPIQGAPKGVLKVMLGKASGKYAWSMSKAAQAAEAYLSTQAEPPPAGAKETRSQASEPAGPPVPGEPSIPGREEPSATATSVVDAEPEVKPARLVEKKKPVTVAVSPEVMPSAHSEGEAIEAKRGSGTGKSKTLSSSRIFTPAQSGKDMVLTRDSASFKSEAGAAGKLIRKIPVGEKVERIDAKGGSLKVVSGADTGWIKSADAVYEDEMTLAQEQAIQTKITSKLSKAEAAEARRVAAEALAVEKARKAEAAAAEAQRKAAEKLAAKEAKLAEKKAAEEARLAEKKAAEEAKLAAKKAAEEAKQAAKEAKLAAKAQAKIQAEAEAGHFQEAAAATRTGAGLAGGPSGPLAQTAAGAPKLGLADNPELANKLAQEKLAADDEKKRIEPEENRVSYNSFGRRDPFIPVEQGASDNGIDIDQMKVVGIIWQSSQPLAVLEHNREAGVSFTVKEGDPVHNGRVARISHDAVTFDISEYGISRSYSLRLVSSNTKEGAKK